MIENWISAYMRVQRESERNTDTHRQTYMCVDGYGSECLYIYVYRERENRTDTHSHTQTHIDTHRHIDTHIYVWMVVSLDSCVHVYTER